jgi:hypothetical protein
MAGAARWRLVVASESVWQRASACRLGAARPFHASTPAKAYAFAGHVGFLMSKSLARLLFPSVLILASCEGCDSNLVAASRSVAVDVCTGEPNLENKGGTDQCLVDFGLVDLTVRTTREVIISNVGEEDIIIRGARTTETSDPAYEILHFPDLIKPGARAAMVLAYRPMLSSQVEADVVLTTNAQNALNPGEGEVSIHINGAGADNGLPNLQVDVVRADDLEACCDLGLVPVGTAANCLVRLTNTGVRDLVLDEVGFLATHTVGAGTVWQTVGALPNPTNHNDDDRFTIKAAESATLSFKFLPEDLSEREARVYIKTNAPRACGQIGAFDGEVCNRRDYDEPCEAGTSGEVLINLRGQGAEPPTCIAKIKSVNGSSAFDPRLIEPLDDVELSAEDSTTSVPGLSISEYHWTITRKPPGSNVRFDSDVTATPHFMFDNTATNQIVGLDVAGEYEVRCDVTDSRGTTSVNDGASILTLVATPSEAIHLQMVWDAPDTDVDLHMIREHPSGTYNRNTEDDCYFSNCKPTSFGGAPIWDDSHDAHEGGNPKLDVDDTEGYGPENSNIDAPLTGKYRAGVCYWSDHGNGDTVVTLRVYIYGNLVAEYNQLLRDGEWWVVGDVDWSNTGAAAWLEVNTVDTAGDCQGF